MKAHFHGHIVTFVVLCVLLLGSGAQAQSFTELQEVQAFAPPDSLDQLFTSSDCVVLVEMNRGVERSYQIAGSPGPNVRTEFSPTTLELFKQDGHTCGTTGMTVLHQTVANGVLVDGKMIRVNGKRPFVRNERYVLFLSWHAAYQAYDFMFGSAAAYKIRGGTVSIDDSHSLSRAWSGRGSEDLLTALRTLRSAVSERP